MSKFLHGPPKFSRGPSVGDRCFRGSTVRGIKEEKNDKINSSGNRAPSEYTFLLRGVPCYSVISLTSCSCFADNISVVADGIAVEISHSMEPTIILPFISCIHHSIATYFKEVGHNLTRFIFYVVHTSYLR
jgi:hypothetical protein